MNQLMLFDLTLLTAAVVRRVDGTAARWRTDISEICGRRRRLRAATTFNLQAEWASAAAFARRR